MARRSISPVTDRKQKGQTEGLTEDSLIKGLYGQVGKIKGIDMKWW